MTQAAVPENSNETALRRVPGRPFPPGQTGNPNGRPKKGNAIRDLLKNVPLKQKRELVRIAYEEAIQNKDYHWAEWIAKHSGESGSSEREGPVGLVRELIVREYGFDPEALD